MQEDFPYWKSKCVLMNYKPAGWDKIYKDFKDKDGAWTGIYILAFGNVVNPKVLGTTEIPKNPKELLNPELKGKLISTYPNDDDAVLFWYKQNIDKYGWEWLEKLMEQNPTFVRGTQEPNDQVGAGKQGVTLGTAGNIHSNPQGSYLVIPEKDGFVAWAQRAAILKNTKHPEAAKLYMNWILDKDTQENVIFMWGVRTDVKAPEGRKQIWEYKNSNLKEFEKFMSDRAGVERFKAQIALFVGDVKGESSAGKRGLYPDKR